MSWKLMPMSPPHLRHRLRLEDLQRPQPEIAHPLRLVLHLRNLGDDLRVDPALGLEDAVRLGDEIVFVDFADAVGDGGGC